MKRFLSYSLVVLGAIMLFSSKVDAQVIPDSIDQHFLTDAANSNLFKIALGTQALTQSENEEIKQYGQMLVDDHSKILEELKEAAVAKKLVMPSAIEEREATLLKSLSTLSGVEFDTAFKEIAINTHKHAIVLFEKGALRLNDPELKDWADQKVPSLKSHLEHAQALNVGD